jgi:hypothetical protein
MSDRASDGVDPRAAVGVADGSLTGDERARAQARLEATAEGRRALEQQQRVVRALRAGGPAAPPGLRAAVDAQTARPRRPRVRGLPRAALAGGLLAALLAVALVVAGGLGRQPTVASALELGTRPATGPAPPPQSSRPTLLAGAVDGVAFPNWALARHIAPRGTPRIGWKPVGARRDEIAGRRTETVFYQHMDHRVAYTIIAGDALDFPPEARKITIAGRPLWALRDGERHVVVFTRHGHTCVLGGNVISRHTLERLATWRADGSISF